MNTTEGDDGAPPEPWRHLPYAEIEAYVDGRLDAIDREIVEGHAAACPACAGELQDLAGFRAALAAMPVAAPFSPPAARGVEAEEQPSARRASIWKRFCTAVPVVQRGPSLAFGSAAALVAAVVVATSAAGVQTMRLTARERSARVVEHSAAAALARADSLELEVARLREAFGHADRERADLLARSQAAEEARTESDARAGAASARLDVVLAENRRLRDRPAHVERPAPSKRLAHSALAVPEPLPGAVRVAMAEGRLPRMPDLSGLGTLRRGDMRGFPNEEGGPDTAEAPERVGFELNAPAGTRVLSDRPAFSWEPAPGAAHYSVFVADAADNIVARSTGGVVGTRWSLPAGVPPLPRGKALSWQVHAFRADGVEIGGTGEGRFEVAPEAEARRVRALAARRELAASPVGRAAVYASSGLLDDAEAALAKAGTGPRAGRLRAQVRAARPAAVE